MKTAATINLNRSIRNIPADHQRERGGVAWLYTVNRRHCAPLLARRPRLQLAGASHLGATERASSAYPAPSPGHRSDGQRLPRPGFAISSAALVGVFNCRTLGDARMKLRMLVAVAVSVVFLSVFPRVYADEHHGIGDYDQHHEWHAADWWRDHDPKWVQTHHPDWLANGDWDKNHHWHDRTWWKAHDPKWVHEHHHDWL
jgi:hypothetical protein